MKIDPFYADGTRYVILDSGYMPQFFELAKNISQVLSGDAIEKLLEGQ